MEYHFLHLPAAMNGENARIIKCAVRGFGVSGQDSEVGLDPNVEVVQPLGLLARPKVVNGLDALVIQDQEELVVLAMRDKTRGAPDLDPGDTQVENFDVTARVRLHGDGHITIEGKDAAGTIVIGTDGTVTITAPADKNIVLNGGTVWLAKASGTPSVPPTDGAVLGRGIDPFTGQTYAALGSATTKVRAAG